MAAYAAATAGQPGAEQQAGCVRVVGFGRSTLVFGSKQRPKRIEVYCDDYSTRRFLVKVGT